MADGQGEPGDVRMKFGAVKDSGERTEFDSGAVRDRQSGKGRYDLLSVVALRQTARATVKHRLPGQATPHIAYLDSALFWIFDTLRNTHTADERMDTLATAAANMHWYVHFQEPESSSYVVVEGATGHARLSPIAVRRLATHFENGAEKYADRNWEKGMPLSRFIDSAARHMFKVLAGLDDEDHAAAAEWNVHCAIHTLDAIGRGVLPAELDDLPRHEEDAA